MAQNSIEIKTLREGMEIMLEIYKEQPQRYEGCVLKEHCPRIERGPS